MSTITSLARLIRRDPVVFAAACGITLRPYQEQIASAIKDSIVHARGLTFVVILPRQSGKNEVQRHLFAWLLYRAAQHGGSIVSIAPTFKPQTVNAMERVRLTLDSCIATRGAYHTSGGYIFRFHNARLQFFSGETHARVVGATADLLLSVDEAQDIDPAKFDKDFDPMTASTNATRVFWGTAWTSQTLLARQARIARDEQSRDGTQRLFYFTGDDVARIVPAYGAHLERVVRERGRQHPLVRTQYFNEEIDAVAGMFTPERMALMTYNPLPPPPNDRTGSSPATPLHGHLGEVPKAEGVGEAGGGGLYAFCIDVAGQDEAAVLDPSIVNRKSEIAGAGRRPPQGVNSRDSTTLSIIQVDLSSLPTLHAPTYRVVHRQAWTGISHVTLFGQLKALAEAWNPQHIVIDATGVGEGLWSLLDRAFPARVIPVKFSAHTKSEIGWRFLSIIETGRFKAFSSQLSAVSQTPTAPAGHLPQTPALAPGAGVSVQAPSIQEPLHAHLGEAGRGSISNLQSEIENSEIARLQYIMCQSEILPGPSKLLRWGVPDGTRGPDGSFVHDDFVLADSLVAKLDELRWSPRFAPFVIPARDPLEGTDRFGEE